MLKSIVHIESLDKKNHSFGTGFVIDNDENGAYILTCQHVLDEVGTGSVEQQEVEIVATSDFLDMAVIHVKNLTVPALQLQLSPCHEDAVHAIGFATFSTDLVQKKEIHATLFQESIELHSKEDDSFYVVRRIKANDDYTFERGNSGSPLICKSTGSVIAMISNKEGSQIAYAIEIACLKEIWKDLNTELQIEGTLHNHQHFYDNIKDFTGRLKEDFQERRQEITGKVTRLRNMDELEKELNTDSKLKYYLSGIGSMLLFWGLYYLWTLPPQYEPENYKVVNIKSSDTLNVRAEKGTVYEILGELPHDARNVAVTLCESNDAGKEWCQITYGSLNGWVRSKYIEKEPKFNTTSTNYQNKSYFRSRNDNLFFQFTYSPSVKRGNTILISALLENIGKAENTGGVTLSFPQRPLLQYNEDYSDFDKLQKFQIFDEIYNNHENQKKKMNAIHPVIEAHKLKWTKNETHIFALSIKAPDDLNVLRIRVRASLTLDRVVPKNGTLDQQAFYSEEIVIRIEE